MQWLGWAIPCALALALLITIWAAWARLSRLWRSLFGARSVRQVVEEGQWEEEHRPKSVSSMTRLCLPRVQADFPDFSWEEMRLKAGNALRQTLMALDAHQESFMPREASLSLRDQVRGLISGEREVNAHTRYREIEIHDTQMVGYEKTGGVCTLRMQTALGCLRWREEDGEVKSGSRERRWQTKYAVAWIYVQDAEGALAAEGSAAATVCPQCGAPVKSLGNKHCEYCGAAIIEYMEKVWRFGAMEEMHT